MAIEDLFWRRWRGGGGDGEGGGGGGGRKSVGGEAGVSGGWGLTVPIGGDCMMLARGGVARAGVMSWRQPVEIGSSGRDGGRGILRIVRWWRGGGGRARPCRGHRRVAPTPGRVGARRGRRAGDSPLG